MEVNSRGPLSTTDKFRAKKSLSTTQGESVPVDLSTAQVGRLIKMSATQEKIVRFCDTPRHLSEIMDELGVTNRGYFKKNHLDPLIVGGVVRMTHPSQPRHPNQGYVLTDAGVALKDRRLRGKNMGTDHMADCSRDGIETPSRSDTQQDGMFEAFSGKQRESRHSDPVECLGQKFANDEARRTHFLRELRSRLEELQAKLGGVPYSGIDDTVMRLKSVEHWPMGNQARLRELSERMSDADSSKDLLQRWKDEVGFPHGEIEDIVGLSDPPWFTACPNPFATLLWRHTENPTTIASHTAANRSR